MSISTPASLAMRNAVLPFLNELTSEDPVQKVLVGVSGGADSLALAATLFEFKEGLEIIPVVVDHGLQAGSHLVALAAKNELEKIGFENIFMAKASVEITDGVEASARRARYLIFEQALENFASKVFFLAHNKNDQAETVLLGLLRGSGARSLEGMRSKNGRYIRPLLEVERKTTELCCEEKGINFWNDPHNRDERFTRVRIREKIMPLMIQELGAGVITGLSQSAEQFQRDNDFFNELRDKLLSQIIVSSSEYLANHGQGVVNGAQVWGCDGALLTRAHPAIRTRALREILISRGVPADQLNFDHYQAINKMLESVHNVGPIYLPGGMWARISDGTFLIEGSDRQ